MYAFQGLYWVVSLIYEIVSKWSRVFPTLGDQNLFFPGQYLPVITTVKTGYRPKPSNPDQ